MYRQYENPRALEEELEALKNEIAIAIAEGIDGEELSDMYFREADLKERINFAWQDEEYDELSRSDY